MISAGTLVRIRTTNGGDIFAVLEEDYVPSYDVVAQVIGSGATRADRMITIPAERLSEVSVK